VCDGAGQLSEHFELLRLRQAFLRTPQIFLRLASLGDVARHLGKADKLSGFIADGAQHDAGPEIGSILADAPTLRLVGRAGRRLRQGPLRHSGGAVLRCVEAREMLTDDLVCAIALDTLCAAVPA